MIITFATQKGGTGKTTLAIAFSNYLSTITERKITAFDFDFQKSFYNKWKEDEFLDIPKLYDVEALMELKESEDINIFDLAGTLDAKYSDLLVYSDVIVTPFEYSDVSAKSTLVFVNLLGLLESTAERDFIRSRYDKGFKYPNQEDMDNEIEKFGTLINTPVYKRNCLQNIDTRRLTPDQKYAVKKPFQELINFINEALQITI